MTDNTVTKNTISANSHCECPKCGGAGASLGALNYAETQQWEKSGRFSGAGVGIGTGGLGIGVGGGTYSEQGESRSKRAGVFKEPEPISIPVGPIIVVGILGILGLQIMPDVLSAGIEDNGVATAMLSQGLELLRILLPLISGVFIIGLAMIVIKSKNEEDRINSQKHPKRLARYNSLRYCDSCHTLYDSEGRFEDANKIGFDKLMQNT